MTKKNKVSVDDLIVKEFSGNEYFFFIQPKSSKKLEDILKETIEKSFESGANLAKKLTDQAFGIVTTKARFLISEVLEENPYQIDALYLAGLTAFQNSRNDIAKKVWSTVFEINPETKYKNSINENLLKMK